MKKMSLFLFILILLLISNIGFAQYKMGFFVGMNNSKDKSALRYAKNDANKVSAVFTELGGVNKIWKAEDPTYSEFHNRLIDIKTIFKTVKDKNKIFIFYYSGHSDKKGLILKDTTYPYRELRRFIKSFPVKLRIYIMDSCYSGAALDHKAGRFVPATISNPSKFRNLRSSWGEIWLTSSSSTEESYEDTKTLKSSYFSYFLRLGLLGFADTNNDKLVSLREAHAFAYYNTAIHTKKNPQRPLLSRFNYRNDNLILSSLKSKVSTLKLSYCSMVSIYKTRGYYGTKLGVPVGTWNPKRLYIRQISIPFGKYLIIEKKNGILYKSYFSSALNSGSKSMKGLDRTKISSDEYKLMVKDSAL